MYTHSGGDPLRTSPASSPSLTKRTASALTIVVRRENRSAITPPNSSNTSSGTVSAASTSPTSPALPPRSSTPNVKATGTIAAPTSDTTYPVKNSRKSRSPSTPRRSGSQPRTGITVST